MAPANPTLPIVPFLCYEVKTSGVFSELVLTGLSNSITSLEHDIVYRSQQNPQSLSWEFAVDNPSWLSTWWVDCDNTAQERMPGDQETEDQCSSSNLVRGAVAIDKSLDLKSQSFLKDHLNVESSPSPHLTESSISKGKIRSCLLFYSTCCLAEHNSFT